MHTLPSLFRPWLAPALAATLLACSPGLNWRELRLEKAGISLMFPCKPEHEARIVRAGTASRPALEMGLAVCTAEGARFSLAWADVEDPAKLEPALMDMRASLIQRLHGQGQAPKPVNVPGMTPNPGAMTQGVREASAEGQPVQAEVAVFARGLRVYQLVLLGPRGLGTAWESFLGSAKLQD